MRIGELARRTGVDEQLLRYYEKQGLLVPERSANGYREYDEADVGAVQKIRGLLAAGLSTATIAEVSSCLRDDSLPTPACAGVVERLRGERERIDQVIQGLLDARAALDNVIHRGEGAGSPTPGHRTPMPDPAGRPGGSRPRAASNATGRRALNLR
ncbi:MerR family transcriptional regulator [Microtetraspora malaysiensis]|uniref:MerR family transcriptional regulator n=1 Tax=Microtetraspora malaysiensis TaxID=161358 RepID=UPI0009FCAABE|nr:MerR family transcriptional regulator [Microtetraspora malaysiensis]